MRIKIWWPLIFICLVITASILIFPSEVRLADLLSDAGKFDDAIETYRNLLQKFPHRDDFRIQLSKIYLLKNEPKKAANEIDRIDPSFDYNVTILKQLADIFSSLKDKKNTVHALEKIVVKYPNDQTYQMKLADAYQWNGQNMRALIAYEAIYKQHPETTKLLQKLITLSLAEKDYKTCRRYLQIQLEQQPNDDKSRQLFADVLLADNHKREAALEYEKILQHDPRNRTLREKLANLYQWMNDAEKSRHHYEYLVRTYPANKHYFNEFIELTKNRDPERALKYFQKRLHAFPNDTTLQKRYIDFTRYNGFIDEAITASKRLAEKHPENETYLKNLAYLYKEVRQTEQAQKTFVQLFKKEDYKKLAFHELKYDYQEQKEYGKLLKLFAKADHKDILSAQDRRDYVDLLMVTRNYNPAIHQCVKLLGENPADANTRIRLANLYLVKKKNKDAADVVRNGMNVKPVKKTFLLYASRFFEQQHLLPEGIQVLEKLAALEPDNLEYKKRLLSQSIKTHNFDRAEELYLELIGREPDNNALKLEYASLFWEQGDFATMKSILNDVIASGQNEENIHKKVGRFYFEKGFLDEAIDEFAAVLQASPMDSVSLRMIGQAYAWNNQPALADVYLNRFLSRYAADASILFQSAQLLNLTNKKAEARTKFLNVLQLVENKHSRDLRLIKAKTLAFLGRRKAAISEFESLKNDFPDESSLELDYAEGLIELKEYAKAEDRLNNFLQNQPGNYRAYRLLSTCAFEQGHYKNAISLLRRISNIFPGDSGLQLDLADSELAAGDWIGSSRTLKSLLKQFPNNLPGRERLNSLRRGPSERVATDYLYENQSHDIFRQMYRAVLTKATKWLAFTFSSGEERYSSNDPTLSDQTYTSFSAKASSSLRSKLQSSVSVKTQNNGNDWFVSGTAKISWKINRNNTLTLHGTLNDLWFDPFSAAFFQGRVNRLASELSLNLYKRIVIWSRLSYESNDIHKNDHFGNTFRTDVQLGYQWWERPNFITYYQLYYFNYRFQRPDGPSIIPIPETDTIHYFGTAFSQQLTQNLYTHLNGSVGYNTIQTSAVFYGAVDFEYLLLNRLRFKTLFSYGNENRLNRNQNTLKLLFDISYFY